MIRQVQLPGAPHIQLHLVDLGLEPSAAELAALSPEERARAARFVFEHHRKYYIAAHCALRTVLSAHTGLAADQLAFELGEFDKPHLPSPAACHFNLSHSGNRAAIAISRDRPIGVDIEIVEDFASMSETAHRVFTAAEIREFEAAPDADRARAFYRGWTRKEACLKAVGSGLSIEPDTFEGGLDSAPRLVSIATSRGTATLQLYSPVLDADCVICAAELLC